MKGSRNGSRNGLAFAMVQSGHIAREPREISARGPPAAASGIKPNGASRRKAHRIKPGNDPPLRARRVRMRRADGCPHRPGGPTHSHSRE
jgi:hypothetical protein